MKRAGVIGGGAWGTALAELCARAGLEVILWAREAEVAKAISDAHVNTLFLPGVALDPAIRATTEIADLSAPDLILAVSPAQHLRSSLTSSAAHTLRGMALLLCAMGGEQGALER